MMKWKSSQAFCRNAIGSPNEQMLYRALLTASSRAACHKTGIQSKESHTLVHFTHFYNNCHFTISEAALLCLSV